MLKEYIDRYSDPNRYAPYEHIKQSFRGFKSMVYFLSENEQFPNREINDIAHLMYRTIEFQELSVAFDKDGLTKMAFTTVLVGGVYVPAVILPSMILGNMRKNMVHELAATAFIASHVKDFYAQKWTPQNAEWCAVNGDAYQAEALLTLNQMAGREHIKIHLSTEEKKVLRQYPHGLRSLPKGHYYPTPMHVLANKLRAKLQ